MESGSISGAANDPAVIGSLTTVHLILIGLFALVVIFVILLATRRRARAAQQRTDAGEASERLSEINEAEPATAPLPPPLADVPVVAAAPLDASPATLAGDIEPAVQQTPEAAGEADDLTRLKGVGPKLAGQLRGFGYTRFSQIATLSQVEADALDAQLGTFKGRLARDRVVEQAGYLAKGDVAGFESVFGKL